MKPKARRLETIHKFPLWEYTVAFYAKNEAEAQAAMDRFDLALCNHKGPDKEGRGCYLGVAGLHPLNGWVDPGLDAAHALLSEGILADTDHIAWVKRVRRYLESASDQAIEPK